MDLYFLQNVLLGFSIVNIALLFLCWISFLVFHKRLYKLFVSITSGNKEDFYQLSYVLLISFELAIILFNFVPWIALNLI